MGLSAGRFFCSLSLAFAATLAGAEPRAPEIVLGWPDSTGAVLVLMHWPDQPRPYEGNDVKLVFYVDEPAEVIERIRERGGRIDREATPHDAVNGAIVGLGRDPDNYVVEVLER